MSYLPYEVGEGRQEEVWRGSYWPQGNQRVVGVPFCCFPLSGFPESPKCSKSESWSGAKSEAKSRKLGVNRGEEGRRRKPQRDALGWLQPLRSTAVPPPLPCAIPASLSFDIARTPTRARSCTCACRVRAHATCACVRTSVGPLSPSSLCSPPPPLAPCTCMAAFAPRPAPLSRRPPCRHFRGMLSPPRRRMRQGWWININTPQGQL